MKVGILTFHMAHNCGAMLQAYALSKCITEKFSVDCEIIDYRLPIIYHKYDKLLKKKPIEPKRLKFDKYMKSTLPISKHVEELSKANEYDLYIVGSDQVWNSQITKGLKDEYFAKFFPDNSFCISYAASTGEPIEDPKLFAEKLDNFRYISVRESWLVKQLQQFVCKEIIWCLDPVLLLESTYWNTSCKKVNLDKYILVYSFEITSNEYLTIKSWAKQENLSIIELITHERGMQNDVLYEHDYGPEEWIAYIKNASYVFTDSYHCTLFSIIFNKEFYCLDHGSKRNSRIEDILNQLSLSLNKNNFYYATHQSTQCLEESRTQSLNFLKTVIERVKNEKTNI